MNQPHFSLASPLGTFGPSLVLPVLIPAPLPAQIDYRNLDDGRPIATEDAYPVERYAFELLAPYRFEPAPEEKRFHAIARGTLRCVR